MIEINIYKQRIFLVVIMERTQILVEMHHHPD